MFGFRKKPHAAAPQVSYRDAVRYQSTPEDAALKARHHDLIARAESEYARLTQIANENLRKRDAGEHFSQADITRANAKSAVIADMLAILKGVDAITEVARLDAMARTRRDEVFPLTTFLHKNPLYAEV